MNDEEPTEAKPSRELFGSGWVEDKTECDQNDEGYFAEFDFGTPVIFDGKEAIDARNS